MPIDLGRLSERAGDRPVVMGIVNVTPDSFSDGGKYADTVAAVAHGLALGEHGADIVDIGGESTRPGATRPLLEQELDRVVPVIAELVAAGSIVSVDTMRHEVAAAALEAGATLVNDVSGGLADPDILRVVAEARASYVAMHWRAHADTMQQQTSYPDGVVATVLDELARRRDAALAAGVAPDRLVVDPGLGFAKTAAQNWELLGALERFTGLGRVLVGSPRKSFLGSLLADAEGRPRPVESRDDANTALTALVTVRGAWGVRVHDVRASVDAARVAARLRAAAPTAPPAPGAAAAPGPVDELTVRGIECFAHHGVFDFEREQGQRFVVDVTLGLDTRPAAAGDELARTVHYGVLTEDVKRAVESDPVDLVETLVERIARVCLLRDAVEWARVTVHKPEAPIDATFADVALTITRHREGAS